MTKEELGRKVSTVQECIIETPLAEVFVDGKSIGFYNEYTIRRIQLAVKRKELPNNFTFVFKNKEHKIVEDGERGDAYISPNFSSGFYNLSYLLTFTLTD